MINGNKLCFYVMNRKELQFRILLCLLVFLLQTIDRLPVALIRDVTPAS